MVRLLVEEACDALPMPPQHRRNGRFLISTQPRAPSREAGRSTTPGCVSSCVRLETSMLGT